MGGVPRSTMDTLLVRVDTDTGVTGWGEAFGHRIWPATKAAIDTLIAPLCIGRDATNIEVLLESVARILYNAGRSGPTIYGLSGIDIALWDIAGKVASKPLYQLLGGRTKKDLMCYASLLHYGEPDAVARYTAQAVSRGYQAVKIHEIGFDQIGAARDAAGSGTAVMVDCNCPWTPDEAIAMAEKLTPLDLTWLEEPVWPPEDFAGLARLRERGVATAAGENATSVLSFKHMFDAGALTYAQPSVAKIGGVTQMLKVIALADSSNVAVVPHSAYFGPGLLASIQVIAAMKRESMVERFYCDFEKHILGNAINPINGRIDVPQGPGLGVDPDPSLIAAYRE
jgi:L-alanine-DL-glutamate epimerase-like enolase superfamily enzyme